MPVIGGQPGGQIVNNPVAGSILNQSNIGHSVAKLQSMPVGWHQIDGYKEHFLRDDTEAVALFEGPWSSRDQFYDWALGYQATFMLPGPPVFQGPGIIIPGLPPFGQIINSPATPFLSRNPPAQHWRFPWLFCTGVELVRGNGAYRDDPQATLFDVQGNPLLDANGVPVPCQPGYSIAYYDSANGSDQLSAVVAVTYRQLDYSVLTDAQMLAMPASKIELERNVIRESDPSANFLPLPSGQIKFTAGPQAGQAIPDNAANIILFREELTYTWVDVPDPPFAAMQACTGRVNSVAFDGAGGGAWPTYAAGTLLCQAAKRKRHRSPTGRVSWDIISRMLFNPDGWNNLPASDGAFYPVAYANLNTLFRTADLNTLFQPVAPVAYQ